jgi:hypothetical protein
VETENVLADDVVAGRPEGIREVGLGDVRAGGGGRVGERRVVVEERVEPDVEDVL